MSSAGFTRHIDVNTQKTANDTDVATKVATTHADDDNINDNNKYNNDDHNGTTTTTTGNTLVSRTRKVIT